MPEISCASYMRIHAREVHRMAIKSLADIEQMRNKAIQTALEEAEKKICTHWFGLIRHKKYPTRQHAMEYSRRVAAAHMFAYGDTAICEMLKSAAEYLLDPANKAEDQYINVTAFDYRALS